MISITIDEKCRQSVHITMESQLSADNLRSTECVHSMPKDVGAVSCSTCSTAEK